MALPVKTNFWSTLARGAIVVVEALVILCSIFNVVLKLTKRKSKGFKLKKRVRQVRKELGVKIKLVEADSDAVQIPESLEEPFVLYYEKPVDEDVIEHELGHIIDAAQRMKKGKDGLRGDGGDYFFVKFKGAIGRLKDEHLAWRRAEKHLESINRKTIWFKVKRVLAMGTYIATVLAFFAAIVGVVGYVVSVFKYKTI